jgi:hypothetical protein
MDHTVTKKLSVSLYVFIASLYVMLTHGWSNAATAEMRALAALSPADSVVGGVRAATEGGEPEV